jgi:tetratricopeptide (TPR) repeat protein
MSASSRPARSLCFRRVSVAAIALAVLVGACGWDPTRPFDREAPQVNDALRHYDAGEAGSAAELLQDYLTTGACSEGNIGTPLRVRERPNGSFDLGLALFKVAEAYGHRFGDEENDAGLLDPNLKGMRAGQVECALRVVRAVAEDPGQPSVALRARARYLEGNLLFLTAAYKEAVTAYDRALELVPAMGDAGPIGTNTDAGKVTYTPDSVLRDAAWNRAVALRRIEDKKDADQDAAPPDGGGDGGDNQNQPDGGNDDKNQPDSGNDDKNQPDSGKDSGGGESNQDAGKDAGGDDQNKPPPKSEPKDEEEQPPPPSRQSQDDRILDQLENAPTVQQEAAKKQGKARRVRGMADK